MGESGAGRADLERQRRWADLHHGIDPAGVPLLLPWLKLMWRLAAPVAARRVPPAAITGLGVALSGLAVATAPRRPAMAAALVPAAAVCDGLDGAVAVLGGRSSPRGARADAVADRVVDTAFAAVLWRCGAPAPMATIAAAAAVGVDVLRRRRRVPTVITVAERPSWTVCATLACASAARTTAGWPVRCCALVWLALGAIGLGQIVTRPPAGPSNATVPVGAGRASGL
jgi:CDP-diacylglycerol--glycerol-3-phosphate 3-phosphatidyltransferase